jgi:DNA gyrase subunit A
MTRTARLEQARTNRRASSATSSVNITRTATQSIYDALVRMAQDFSMRLPLIDGQGNFGSVDGDPPAAMRYTESGSTKPRMRCSTTSTRTPSISRPTTTTATRADGSAGAVSQPAGQRRRRHRRRHGDQYPPHNLGEVIDACVALIDDPALTSTS